MDAEDTEDNSDLPMWVGQLSLFGKPFRAPGPPQQDLQLQEFLVPPLQPARPGIRHLTLQQLPEDILFSILDQILPGWVKSMDSAPYNPVPTWIVSDLSEPVDINITTRHFYNLCQVSKMLNQVATPFLYRFIPVHNVETMLKLWSTLIQWCPERATCIRHLLMGIRVEQFDIYSKAEVFVRDLKLPVQRALLGHFWKGLDPKEPNGKPFVWSDGRLHTTLDLEVAPMKPVLCLKVYFDIIGRAKQLVSISMISPDLSDRYHLVSFRDGIGQAASPTMLRPTQYLQNISSISIEIKDRPKIHLREFGLYTMPALRRLVLVNDDFTWFLYLRKPADVSDSVLKRTSESVLKRAFKLCICPGASDATKFMDLLLGLEILVNLRHLTIHPHPSLLATRPRRRAIKPVPLDLNKQLLEHGRGLQALDIAWCLGRNAISEVYLGPLRQLTVVPRLSNLVHLTTSTQVLFGSLAHLIEMLYADRQDDWRKSDMSKFLRSLPATLQRITLTEHWDDSEMAPREAPDEGDEDYYGHAFLLDTWHAGGDWMEMRLRDEQASAGRYDAKYLARHITTAHDFAMLELVRRVGKVWLKGSPLKRDFEVRAQCPAFYKAYTHQVVMDEHEGVGGGLLGEVRMMEEAGGGGKPPGREVFWYAFTKDIFFRGLDAVVPSKRPRDD